MTIERFLRVFHRWIAGFILLPMMVTAVTGGLLILRHQLEWVQPASLKQSPPDRWASIETVYAKLLADPKTQVEEWQDIASIIVKPSKGIFHVRTAGGLQVQMAGTDAEILSILPRRTGLLITLHEGSFWGDDVRYYLFFPAVIGLLLLLISGAVLFYRYYQRQLRRHFKK